MIAAVQDMGNYLRGQNPLLIERHWQLLTKAAFYRGGAILSSAVAGLDQALWDIAGKTHGVPVHELLGGPTRDRMRVYAWIGGDRTGDYSAGRDRPGGARSHQRRLHGAEDERAAPSSARSTRRPRPMASPSAWPPCARRSAATATSRSTATAASRAPWPSASCRCSSRYQPLFVEEAVLPEYPEAFKELAQVSSVPLATGERMFSRWEYKQLVDSGLAVWQPDPSHAGGISETRRICSMAETYDISIAPHSAIGPLCLAASLQIDFAIPNALIQEQGVGYKQAGLDNAGADILDYLVDTSVFDADRRLLRTAHEARPRHRDRRGGARAQRL